MPGKVPPPPPKGGGGKSSPGGKGAKGGKGKGPPPPPPSGPPGTPPAKRPPPPPTPGTPPGGARRPPPPGAKKPPPKGPPPGTPPPPSPAASAASAPSMRRPSVTPTIRGAEEGDVAGVLGDVQRQMAAIHSELRSLREAQSPSPQRERRDQDAALDIADLPLLRPPPVISIVERIFDSMAHGSGSVPRLQFRDALLNEPELLGAPSGQLVNQPAVQDVLSCERLVRLLAQPHLPSHVDWDFVTHGFGQLSAKSAPASEFEARLKKVFVTLDVNGTGKVKVASLVRLMDMLHPGDSSWESVSSVLQASPDKWHVSWNELSALLAGARSTVHQGSTSPVRTNTRTGGGNWLDENLDDLLQVLGSSSPSSPLRYTASPPRASSPGYVSVPPPQLSPAAAKRQLRVGAVSERIAALKSTGANRPGDKARQFGERLGNLEGRIGELQGRWGTKWNDAEGQLADLEAQLQEEGRRTQRGAKHILSAITQLKDGYRSGSVKREMLETVAPRIYKYLVTSADSLSSDLRSSPLAQGRENINSDHALSLLQAQSNHLDRLIHEHGVSEEKLTRAIKQEIDALNAGIEEERTKRKHMETVFVSLMESIITRLYDEMNETLNERKAMDARLRSRLEDALRSIHGAAQAL